VTRAERLLERADEANDPRQAGRLRQEAAAAAEADARRAAMELTAQAPSLEGDALERVAQVAGEAFEAVLARVPLGRRAAVRARIYLQA